MGAPPSFQVFHSGFGRAADRSLPRTSGRNKQAAKFPTIAGVHRRGDWHFRESLSRIRGGTESSPLLLAAPVTPVAQTGMAENAAAEHHSFTGASCLLVFLGCLGFTLCAGEFQGSNRRWWCRWGGRETSLLNNRVALSRPISQTLYHCLVHG